MKTPMEYSLDGTHLTEQFEGRKLKAYYDGGGVLTIGYGHTGPDVKPGMTITEATAEVLLKHDIAWASLAVNKYVKVDLTQGQFDSLVDFTFNVGVEAFRTSTLLKLLNQGQYEEASLQFSRWNKDNGKVVDGLSRRRTAELAEFRS